MPPLPFLADEVESSIAQRFERVLQSYAEQLAIYDLQNVNSPVSLTYAQLDRAAEQIAHTIIAQQNNGNSHPAAILTSHGIHQITGMLGVLKAGQFFLTLSAGDPLSRLEEILADADSQMILTDQANLGLAGQLSSGGRQLINIEQVEPGPVSENGLKSQSPDAVAAILYTSGSTGKPKGVIRSQRNLLHRACYEHQRNQIGSGVRRSLMAHSGFAASIDDIFIALLNGATLCPYDLKSLGINGLEEWLTATALTHLHPPIAIMGTFLASLRADELFPAVRQVILGGDRLRSQEAELVRRHFPNSGVIHQYSSSETGIIASYRVDARDEIPNGLLPVGFAVPDKEVLIDGTEDGTGEIVVRSRYLSPGYWKAPELTAKKFQADPEEAGNVLYHSGDLGRMGPDGCLEHLGRMDSIVKIRGFRVGLPIVENTLVELAGVDQAVVVACEDLGGEKHLVAYVVAEKNRGMEQAALTPAVLRQGLVQTLPEYMLPDRYIMMDRLPLTANLKVDRSRLSQPEWDSSPSRTDSDAPTTEIEEKLAELWSGVLGFPAAGAHDNFFDLGGNSLQAAHLFSEIKAVFGVRLPVTTLISAPTLAELGAVIAMGEPRQAPSSLLVPVQEGGNLRPFFCVHGIGGGVIGYTKLARRLGKEQPFYGILPHGNDDKERVDATIPEMARHYIEAIRTVQKHGPYLLGGYCYGGKVAFEMAYQLWLQGERTALLAIIDGYATKGWEIPAEIPFLESMRNFVINLPYWIKYFGSIGDNHLYATLRRKARGILRSIARVFSISIPINPKDFVDNPLDFSDDLLELRRTQRQASHDYIPQCIPGKITVFRVQELPLRHSFDPNLGWKKLTSAGIEIKIIPGRHNTILQEPYVNALAAELLKSIQACGE
jgi:amino acid adenylation domain-containing protein